MMKLRGAPWALARTEVLPAPATPLGSQLIGGRAPWRGHHLPSTWAKHTQSSVTAEGGDPIPIHDLLASPKQGIPRVPNVLNRLPEIF